MPDITFIVPIKEYDVNKFELLLASLVNISVCNQIELIVVYSAKNPKECLEKLKSSAIEIVLISSEPNGIYNAYNIGVSMAKGKWIMFLGGDDFILPSINSLLKQIESFNSFDAIVCQVVFGTKVLKPFKFKQGLVFRNWCHQGVLYKRELFKLYKFDQRYAIQADHKFNIEISKSHKIKYLDIVISYFSIDGFSQTSTDWIFYKDMPKIIKNSFGYFWSVVSLLRKNIGKIKRKLVK